MSWTENPDRISRLSGHGFMETRSTRKSRLLRRERNPLNWSMSHTPELPETGRCVVQGVIPSLHFVLQDRGALSEGEPQQVITDDHHRDPRRANVLLRTSKNHTKLKTRKTCHFRCTWSFFINVFQLPNFFPKHNFMRK